VGQVDVGLVGLVLDLGDDGLLLDDKRLQVLEQLRQLGNRPLDLLQLGLASLDSAEDRRSLACSSAVITQLRFALSARAFREPKMKAMHRERKPTAD
jgi:hypothetical protein